MTLTHEGHSCECEWLTLAGKSCRFGGWERVDYRIEPETYAVRTVNGLILAYRRFRRRDVERKGRKGVAGSGLDGQDEGEVDPRGQRPRDCESQWHDVCTDWPGTATGERECHRTQLEDG